MNLINELRMLAEDLYVNGYSRYSSAMAQAADEIESLQHYRTAYNEWIDKTKWMQKNLHAKYLGMHRADVLKDMISELFGRIEAAEKEIALKERVIDALGVELNAVAKERDALRAKVEQMERQEPVARFNWSKGELEWLRPWNYRTMDMRPLYLAPGTQPAPSVPDDIVREVLRDCCGTFHGSRHRITCEKYKGKKAPEAKP